MYVTYIYTIYMHIYVHMPSPEQATENTTTTEA